jgi:hypothetical protein
MDGDSGEFCCLMFCYVPANMVDLDRLTGAVKVSLRVFVTLNVLIQN